ncbi:hypothetical protein AURDEDRAFT_176707 [Auricularia subglabra TFB-10046 SS5]|uniref:Uncharacterized protein n=1 Tax=Auricularia subglabra (strain TFB-10046 / SS5) TaxID=717982 RepID=J0LCK5_AURST|nr:hypothetical protein AURDEDRAFT_176707 [Auricularia subglabra TFB-10046 SS5]
MAIKRRFLSTALVHIAPLPLAVASDAVPVRLDPAADARATMIQGTIGIDVHRDLSPSPTPNSSHASNIIENAGLRAVQGSRALVHIVLSADRESSHRPNERKTARPAPPIGM